MRIARLLYVLFVAMLALAEPPAGAQQPAKIPRIGVLGFAFPRSPIFQSFQQGLRELGYIEGRNAILEPRVSNGDVLQFHELVSDLVRLKVDVIVAQGAGPIRAAINATRTIPIVFAFVGDAVSEGYVASLERPGGNVTGVNGLKMELGGKWLELIKETIPSAKHLAVFWNKQAENSFPVWKSVESTGRSLGVDIRWEEVGYPAPSWLYKRLRSAALRQIDAFIVLPRVDGTNLENIAEFGLRNRMPGIAWRVSFAEAGGLMSYGANSVEQSRRAAYLVDKILKGAKPSELPVERPTQFELVINLKTAKEIGVTIHPEVLMWADRVIK